MKPRRRPLPVGEEQAGAEAGEAKKEGPFPRHRIPGRPLEASALQRHRLSAQPKLRQFPRPRRAKPS